jgi:hypothetical protein
MIGCFIPNSWVIRVLIDFQFPGLHRHNPRIVSFESTPVKLTLIRFAYGVGGPA